MVDNREFKEGLKATSLFGGVQFFNIIIGVIRSKLVAILLGPEGMGFNGILNSTLQLLNSVSGLGLGTSAVKDVSESYATGNANKLSHTLSIFRKLVWLTGIAGLLICLIFSPLLSFVSFGNYDYIMVFAAISVTVLFMQLTDGQRVLLQGTRHFKYMAKASIIGSIIGLFTSIPLYYCFGMQGVVPAIIISSITSLCLMFFFSNKIEYQKNTISMKTAISEGRDMIKMGFFLSLQGLLSLLMAYLIRIFINRYGGLSEVGLFVAGFAIVDTYMGMVFGAMATEYYPRLASHSSGSVGEFNRTINQQIDISLIILSPLICLFLIFGNLAVTLLYSDKFLSITMMLCLATMGTFFKAPSWCIAYSFLAKSDATGFFYNEVSASTIGTVLKIIFYYYWGLSGVGAAYILGYGIYLFQSGLVCYFRYHYVLEIKVLKIFFFQLALGILCFMLFVYMSPMIRYVLGFFIAVISFFISYKELSIYMNINYLFKNNRNE